jgi:hypothetical protein
MNLRSAVLAAMLAMAAGIACEGTTDPPPPPAAKPWPSLSAKEDVLNTVQRAYNERNSGRYESILDPGFIFFLSDGDVNNGLPLQWDRGIEVTLTQHLFSKTQVGDLPLVKSIEMDVQYENGVQWVEVPNPPAAPAETWYTTTAFYYFQIKVEQPGGGENITYLPDPNAKAQFTVRNAGTDESPKWQLVEMRDLGAVTFAARRMAADTEQSTWGSVKALYRGPQ